MNKIARYAGQAVVYGAIALLFGFFSNAPAYRHLDPGAAQIRVSFAHAGDRKGGCKTWTRKEMAKLAPHQRGPNKCPRERVPLYFEIRVDGSVLFAKHLQPTGLHGDGPAIVYEGIILQPGDYQLDLRLRDSDRDDGFDFRRIVQVSLAGGDNVAIDFRAETGGFILFDRDGKNDGT